MNPKQVRFGIPAMAAALVLASGITGYFCKNPEVFAWILTLLVVAAIVSTVCAVSD